VPDDLDHQWLAEALAHPEGWTPREYDTIVFLLAQAHDSLATTPPHHRQVLDSLNRSIESYERALVAYAEKPVL
jgi:hypothetical protein